MPALVINKRYFIWGLMAAVVVLLLVLGLRPQLQMVEVVDAAHGSMAITVDEEGKTRVVDRFIVSAPVAGFVQRLDLDVGDVIEQGQLLGELEPLRSDVLDPRRRAEAEAQVAAASASLSAAKERVIAARADAEFALSEYKKRERLKEKSFVSEEELDQARTERQRTEAVLRSAKFAVDVARYQLDAANTALQYSAAGDSNAVLQERVAIRAPVSGSVLKIHRKSEGVVSPGAALLELGDPGALEIVVDVLSFDAVRIKPGMAVKINRWGGAPLEGSVRLVEPVGETKISALGVEEQRVWVIVDITSPRAAWYSLGDGYRVEAAFIIWQADDVLQIPSASLFRKGKSWAVFTASGGKARLREVEIGEQNGLSAQILSGLDAGDPVITHPDAALADGARVRLRE